MDTSCAHLLLSVTGVLSPKCQEGRDLAIPGPARFKSNQLGTDGAHPAAKLQAVDSEGHLSITRAR